MAERPGAWTASAPENRALPPAHGVRAACPHHPARRMPKARESPRTAQLPSHRGWLQGSGHRHARRLPPRHPELVGAPHGRRPSTAADRSCTWTSGRAAIGAGFADHVPPALPDGGSVMSSFTDPLVVKIHQRDRRPVELAEGFSYLVSFDPARAIRVRSGFLTDGATVPRPFTAFVRPWGRHGKAAVLHDWLYRWPEWPHAWPLPLAGMAACMASGDARCQKRPACGRSDLPGSNGRSSCAPASTSDHLCVGARVRLVGMEKVA